MALLVSLLTLFSMTKIWAGVFWGKPDAAPDGGAVVLAGTGRVPLPMLLSTGGLVVASLAIAVFAGPLYAYSAAAAADLLEPAGYVTAVLGS